MVVVGHFIKSSHSTVQSDICMYVTVQSDTDIAVVDSEPSLSGDWRLIVDRNGPKTL